MARRAFPSERLIAGEGRLALPLAEMALRATGAGVRTVDPEGRLAVVIEAPGAPVRRFVAAFAGGDAPGRGAELSGVRVAMARLAGAVHATQVDGPGRRSGRQRLVAGGAARRGVLVRERESGRGVVVDGDRPRVETMARLAAALVDPRPGFVAMRIAMTDLAAGGNEVERNVRDRRAGPRTGVAADARHGQVRPRERIGRAGVTLDRVAGRSVPLDGVAAGAVAPPSSFVNCPACRSA